MTAPLRLPAGGLPPDALPPDALAAGTPALSEPAILRGGAVPAGLAAEWEALAGRTGADIYFTPDWTSAWWAQPGRAGEPCCLLFRAPDPDAPDPAAPDPADPDPADPDGRLVAVLPFAVEILWAGPVPVRIARLAGTDPNSAILGMAIEPAFREAALSAALARLLGPEGCDAVSLSPLSALAPEREALAAILKAGRVGEGPDASGVTAIRDDAPRQHTVMRLPARFEDFLAALSKSRRAEYRRDLKKLGERLALESRVSGPDEAAARLDAFAAFHARQWQARGKAGHFADWPGSLAFARALMARLAPKGQARIEEHLGDGAPLSMQFAFRFGSRCWWRLTARSLEPAIADLGAGRVGLVERVAALIAEGVTLVEAGAGEYDYKLSYGGALVPMHRLVIARATPGSRARTALLLRMADLIDLLWYRGWFLRLAPRLRARLGPRFGLRPRPLLRAWIRTRL